jgi:hypothetical protein
MDDKDNPYVILGLTDGPAATEADIKKVRCHWLCELKLGVVHGALMT